MSRRPRAMRTCRPRSALAPDQVREAHKYGGGDVHCIHHRRLAGTREAWNAEMSGTHAERGRRRMPGGSGSGWNGGGAECLADRDRRGTRSLLEEFAGQLRGRSPITGDLLERHRWPSTRRTLLDGDSDASARSPPCVSAGGTPLETAADAPNGHQNGAERARGPLSAERRSLRSPRRTGSARNAHAHRGARWPSTRRPFDARTAPRPPSLATWSAIPRWMADVVSPPPPRAATRPACDGGGFFLPCGFEINGV